MTIIPAGQRLDEVRTLFREYQESLGIDLGFQGFDAELASLPAPYQEPQGGLFLAMSEDRALGCVAFRPLANDVCEMKRLYVRPEGRERGVGRVLCEHALDRATLQGYRTIRLDTLARLESAIRLYRRLGFAEIPAYHDARPAEPLVFMERRLA